MGEQGNAAQVELDEAEETELSALNRLSKFQLPTTMKNFNNIEI